MSRNRTNAPKQCFSHASCRVSLMRIVEVLFNDAIPSTYACMNCADPFAGADCAPAQKRKSLNDSVLLALDARRCSEFCAIGPTPKKFLRGPFVQSCRWKRFQRTAMFENMRHHHESFCELIRHPAKSCPGGHKLRAICPSQFGQWEYFAKFGSEESTGGALQLPKSWCVSGPFATDSFWQRSEVGRTSAWGFRDTR